MVSFCPVFSAFSKMQSGKIDDFERCYYSEEEQLYEMEKMMRSVPNFTPRKHGSIVPNGLDNPDDNEQLIAKSYGEMLRITTVTIQNELFQGILIEKCFNTSFTRK